MLDPFQQILGVDEAADAATLLGLSASATHDPVAIEAALRDQLMRVYQCANVRRDDADRVRSALRHAAGQLKSAVGQQRREGTMRRATAAPVFNLTPFDRLVLAVLVASGGWNSRSRAQLVALAAAWGISVQGLVRVIHGLSQYAQRGGARLGVMEITAGQSWAQMAVAPPSGAAVGPHLLERMTENLSAELKRDDPWPTIKFSLIFGTLTLAACIVGVRIAFKSLPDERSAKPPAAALNPAPATTPRPATDSARTPSETMRHRLATFPHHPTFLGNGLPPEALAAVAEFSTLPAHLDEANRKIAVEDEPSEAVFRHWDVSIQTIASGWILGDASTRNLIDGKVNEVLRTAADRPTVSDRLVSALIPPKAISEPLSIWRGAWQIGTLARISDASSPSPLPPVVIERARALLQQTLADAPVEEQTFEAVAAQWLHGLIPQLVAGIEVDSRTYDLWELWLAAERALGQSERHDRAIADALHGVLATSTDLSRPGPTVNVAARLLHILLERPREPSKQGVLRLFDAEEVSSRDLWVLTSLMAVSDAARWFPDRLILPEDADQRHRWRVRDELAMAWPATSQSSATAKAPSGLQWQVDEKVSQRWSQILKALSSQSSPASASHGAHLRSIIHTSKMIEAAESLAAQDPIYADRVLDEVQAFIDHAGSASGSPSATRAGPRAVPVAPPATDGEWARGYQDAGRNAEQRIQHLQALRSAAGGDLGPTDAEAFVREVYRGSPQEVRTAAQEIVSRFANGPVVAMAMLDQFPEAPANEATARIITEFTGRALPGIRGGESAGRGGWQVAARLALLDHAMNLVSATRDEIDDDIEALINSYVMRLTILRREPRPTVAPLSPQDAASMLAQSWFDRARPAAVANPAPSSWPGLQQHRQTRLRLADGPIQNFVANQLALLDAMIYVLAAEQPSKRQAAMKIYREASDTRNNLSNVLEQALSIERAMARVWELRLASKIEANAGPAAASPTTSTGPSPPRPPHGTPTAASSLASLTQRLEALHPSDASKYFELGEEVFDSSTDAATRALARHLFALAGALAPEQFGRSACLALADQEADPRVKRRLVALAALLSSQAFATPIDAASSPSSANLPAALAVGEAFSHYRRGQGAKALESLRHSAAGALLQKCDHLIPGGAARFIDDCKHYRGQARPNIPIDHVVQMLRLEKALLAGDDRSWSSDLLLSGGPTLIEVDPSRLEESLGVDGSRPYYRNGKWIESGQSTRPAG